MGEDQATTKLVAIARDLGTGARPRESEDDDDGNLFKCVFVCERTTQEMSTVAAPKCALVQSATKVCRPSQRRPAGLPSSKSFLPLASPRTSPRTHRRDESRFLTTSSRIRTHARTYLLRSLAAESRKAARHGVKAQAAQAIFDLAEEAADAVVTTVAETVDAASEVVTETVSTASDAAVEAYQSAASGGMAVASADQAAGGINPAILVAGGAAVVLGGAVALVVALLPKDKPVSAVKAFNILAETPGAKLVDLRPKSAVKEEGTPDLRSIGGRKKYLKVPTDMSEEIDFDRFQGIVDASEFVIFLDSYGGFARDVSKKFTDEKYENVAFVSDGTVGPAGWVSSEMPWREPFAFNLPQFDEVVENYKENPTPANTAAAVLGGVGLLSFLFVEYEGLMEFLSFFIGGSFLASKTLLKEDRETTERQIKQWLNTGEAPTDLVKEVEDFKEKVAPEAQERKPEPVAEPEPQPVAAAAPVEEVVEEVVEEIVEEEEEVEIAMELPEEEEEEVVMMEEEPVVAPEPVVEEVPQRTGVSAGSSDILDLMAKVTGDNKFREPVDAE